MSHPIPSLEPDLAWLSRCFLGTVFVLAGGVKLAQGRRFQDTLAAMELLPPRLSRWVARLLPPLEIGLGAAVVAGWGLPATGWLLLGLLGVFLLVLAWYRGHGGKELVCGCFADFEQKTTTASLIGRNLLLLSVALPWLRAPDHPPMVRSPDEWFLAGTVVLGLLLAWWLASRLVETVRLLRAAGGTRDS